MPGCHTMYLKLFSAQADAIDTLKVTAERLVGTHQEVEEIIMNAPEPEITLMGPEPEE